MAATRDVMDTTQLLALLADGEFHSGERLGESAGLTRAAVWKRVKKLERWGLEVEAGAGRGYRLSRPIELLDRNRLSDQLRRDERFEFDQVDVFTETDSTNRFLTEHPPARPGALRACFAEWQSAGRGRLARRWESPLGSGICMSVAWIYEGTPQSFAAMGLVAGAAIADLLAAHCGIDVQLKWPNDVVWNGRKLGGVLVESRIESHGLCRVVIGFGMNVSVPDAVLAQVSDWPAAAVDLRTAMSGETGSRSALAGALAAQLGALLADFGPHSTSGWLHSWRERDFLRDKAIRVGSEQRAFEGVGAGIDDDGALLVRDAAGNLQRFMAGEASVRAQ